jgi:hypothetical protein
MLTKTRIHSKQIRHQRSVQLRIWRLDQPSNVWNLERGSCQLCQLSAPEHVFPMLEVTGVHPGCLLEQSHGSEHPRKHSGFCSRFSGSVHRHFDGLVVGGNEDYEGKKRIKLIFNCLLISHLHR